MTMRKKSHLLLSHKRMNRYQLDVGLCKHKKIVGGDSSVFLAYKAKFKYTRIEQSSRMGEIDERARLFPLAIVFFNSFPWIEIRKENDTRKTTWINDTRGFGIYNQVNVNLFVQIRNKISFTQREI